MITRDLPFVPVCPVEFGRRMCAAARLQGLEPTSVRDSRGGEHLALPHMPPDCLAGLVLAATIDYTRDDEPSWQSHYKAFVARAFGRYQYTDHDGRTLDYWLGVPDPTSLASLAFPDPATVPRGLR
jgi:hypothetical protein